MSIENRTVFIMYTTPDDGDVFDHIVAGINGFKESRPPLTQFKFSAVADALAQSYPVSMFGSLNSSNSAALQANNYLIMPGFQVMKVLYDATMHDYDYILRTQPQPKWVHDICGCVQSPILIGHTTHGQIEHSKVNVGNVPVWDGKTEPEAIQLGGFLHHFGFTHMGVAHAWADYITRGGILLPSVGDSRQAGQKAAIAAYSVILEAWIQRWPQGYPHGWSLYDPQALATPAPHTSI